MLELEIKGSWSCLVSCGKADPGLHLLSHFFRSCSPFLPTSPTNPPPTPPPPPQNLLATRRRRQSTMDEDDGAKDGGAGQIGPKPSTNTPAYQTPTQSGIPAWMLARNKSVHAPVFGQPSARKRCVGSMTSSTRDTLTIHPSAVVTNCPACPRQPFSQAPPIFLCQKPKQKAQAATPPSPKPLHHAQSLPHLGMWTQ